MAFVIGNDCVSCGTCKENCPAEAIFEGDGKFEIDPEKCVSCGTCAENCPVKTIKNDEE
ncbi:MAG: 4Fe-4S binding protein [Clostridia bacterium]|nr:4Fe-4S binding protein [Clostridia bacterium]